MTDARRLHQSQLRPAHNKFHRGNGDNGKHYWLTPPDLYANLDAERSMTSALNPRGRCRCQRRSNEKRKITMQRLRSRPDMG